MKLVIDVSHNLYESLIKGYELSKLGEREMRKAIQHGTPLPEHHGKWIYDGDQIICSRCRTAFGFMSLKTASNFCPECGAKMEGESE